MAQVDYLAGMNGLHLGGGVGSNAKVRKRGQGWRAAHLSRPPAGSGCVHRADAWVVALA